MKYELCTILTWNLKFFSKSLNSGPAVPKYGFILRRAQSKIHPHISVIWSCSTLLVALTLTLRAGWLVVLGFNATLTAKVISWRLVTHACFPAFSPVLTQLSFQSHRLLFSHASAEVRGKSTKERKFASTRLRTHNHQVMSLTCSPLIHPGGVGSVQDLRTGSRKFDSPGRPIIWPRTEHDSHCDSIHVAI